MEGKKDEDNDGEGGKSFESMIEAFRHTVFSLRESDAEDDGIE